ncbi:biotin--[acetyl-CoA-carboxylase] ligase [Caldisalinibacter kiritimatiensis]|uniref:Bifunctional ligase/repressor BirA n=1 Tax=Caldisalinibacter kiritimatiensis TaxID=1304284 RepID=R1CWX1_9FIRM|nr:biotin--[acetyl-CoA-carboxylase] ligase [Caldisalinibacter kiritimatiensis]EOD01124.1 Biotin-protein ligase/ Biotin operon repressor [Caldisalinibacter kiritimatiensis]
MKGKILELLKKNKGDFVSGQKISEELNVSRTAIWKYMNQLKDEGYEIESVSRKGYRLILTPDVLTYDEIKDLLKTKRIGRDILYFNSIDSTNSKAKQLASDGKGEGTVIISEEQTKGRGRLGRNWVSPKGKGVWMSIIIRPDIQPIDASKITQVTAAAVSKSILELGIKNYIKWPNDIIINNKKVCGILTEMSGELNKINYIVIGIGINVNLDENEIPNDIKDIATSLKIESGKKVSRKQLVANIFNNFEELYEELLNKNEITHSIEICKENSAVLGKEIRVIFRNKEIRGKAVDLTDEGELLIENQEGKIQKIISGEVSIRGVNGYV